MNRVYRVTTQVGGASRTRVWDATTPLAIGHPLRWVIETTEAGVRIRKLAADAHAREAKVHEIPHRTLQKGAELDLRGMSVRIQPCAPTAPVFEEPGRDGSLTAFTCLGTWILESRALATDYTALIAGVPVFRIERRSDGYKLTPRAPELRRESNVLTQGEAVALTEGQLLESTLALGAYTWRFSLQNKTAVSRAKPALPWTQLDSESRFFARALGMGAAAVALLFIVAGLWPKTDPQTEELVPPQFAKLVMSRSPSQPTPPAAGAAAASAKVQGAAVVQAFRAQALQNAVSGLLKGGMTRLLAQSDLVTGPANGRKVLGTRTSALGGAPSVDGMIGNESAKVASVGGEGVAGGKGYGKSGASGSVGQGGAFVSMDMGGSSVEEGLTKDEVGEVIHKHLSEVRYCYESAMLRSPDIQGKLMVSFTIGGSGKVNSADVKSSTLNEPGVDDCIVRRLLTWQFPQPRGKVDVAVTYPFIFKSLGR